MLTSDRLAQTLNSYASAADRFSALQRLFDRLDEGTDVTEAFIMQWLDGQEELIGLREQMYGELEDLPNPTPERSRLDDGAAARVASRVERYVEASRRKLG